MTTPAMRGFERAYESRIFDAVIPFVGRVLLSAIFLASGIGKLEAPADTIGYIASEGLPFPPLAYAAAVRIELVPTRIRRTMRAKYGIADVNKNHYHYY